MLSSAVLAYFGPFPSEYRVKLLNENLKIFLNSNKIRYSANFNFIQFLVSEVDVLKWTF